MSGDFRQIPAIVQSKNKTILDIVGENIFKYSGMEEDFENNNEGSNAGVLTQQYRTAAPGQGSPSKPDRMLR